MSMSIGREILYLSRADVAACNISPARMNAAVDDAFRAQAQAKAFTKPKLMIVKPDGASFRAKGGILLEPAYGAVKWFGYFPGNERRQLPDFHPLILLNEAQTGMPVAVMDGTWISAIRTGAISAVAAKYLARPDATSVGFVACGTQARSNLDALLPLFKLERVVAYSRRESTAATFAREVRERGIAASVVTDPRDAVTGMDIVVTSVPHQSAAPPVLDGAWVSPGTYVAMVDLGYGWMKSTLGAFDRVFTDDLEQSGPGGPEKLNYDGDYAGDMVGLAGRVVSGRRDASERNALIFSGPGLIDAAAAAAVYESAIARGLGTKLPL